MSGPCSANVGSLTCEITDSSDSSTPGATSKGCHMPFYALFYEVVSDYLERRASFREEHLRLARKAYERGELLLAGALGDPPDSALLVFRSPDRAAPEAFARQDPYVTNQLVTRWEVRPWAVVIGDTPDATAVASDK